MSSRKEVVILESRKTDNDMIIAGMNRLMGKVAAEGKSLTDGTIRIWKFFDQNYLRDEAVIIWEGPGE